MQCIWDKPFCSRFLCASVAMVLFLKVSLHEVKTQIKVYRNKKLGERQNILLSGFQIGRILEDASSH